MVQENTKQIKELVETLTAKGYDIVSLKNGYEILKFAKKELPSMIILDTIMPVKNGMEVCKILRLQSKFDDTLIIFLASSNDYKEEIKALENGADEFVIKPIKTELLASKIYAWFRRMSKGSYHILKFGDLCIDRQKYNVSYKNISIILARKEFELLLFLASKPENVFMRNEILESVWGTTIIGGRTVDVHVCKILQKLQVNCIKSVKGVGYKFEFL